MYTSIPSLNLPSQLPSPSHPLGCYRALIWAPCAIQQLSTGYLFNYGSVYMSVPISQFDPPSPPPPTMSACPFSMSATLILPCKYYSAIKRNEIGSFEVMWMNLESVIQREVSQKEKNKYHISSVQFSCSVMSASLWPHGLQHARPTCPSPTPGVYSNPCPLSQWCHPTISPLSVPSSPAFNLSQHQGLFKWVSSSHQVAIVLEFQLQHQSFQWTLRTDLLILMCICGT